MSDQTLQNLQQELNAVIAKLREDHPHYCDSCDGRGGEISYVRGSFWDPPSHDWDPCSCCEGVNPLDVTVPMSEDEYDEMVERTLDAGKYEHPLHQEIEVLLYKINAFSEELL